MRIQRGAWLVTVVGLMVVGVGLASADDKVPVKKEAAKKESPKKAAKKKEPPMDKETAALTAAYGDAVKRTMTERPKFDAAAVARSFAALASFDWGKEYATVRPIDDAVIATQGDAAARKDLETRLAAVLSSGASRDAKGYVCRKLTVIGSAASVPALAALLADKDLTHLARYALERIDAAEAAQALRDALPKLDGALRVGVIGSLGARRDAASVTVLVALLADGDKAAACAAACALGRIGGVEAGTALGQFASHAPEGVNLSAADACLACAEQLLASGKKAEAKQLYKSLLGQNQPKHVRLAATRGLLTTAGK